MATGADGLVLKAEEVEGVRRLWQRQQFDQIKRIKVADITLAGALELACTRTAWQASPDAGLLAQFTEWTRAHDKLRRAWDALVNGYRDRWGPHDAPSCEIRTAPTRGEHELEWDLFLERFKRSAVTNGRFSTQRAFALTKSLAEMVDNVLVHAGAVDRSTPPAVVGYEVAPGSLHYAVADLGCGLLKSLGLHPRWSHLRDAKDALLAATREGASRRSGEYDGEGFREVYRAIADDFGVLRFRTGDWVLSLDGRGEARSATFRRSPPLTGFQLAVHVAFKIPT